MSDDVMDELGPIDYLVVEFPAGKADFSGAMAEQLKALVEAGTIRVLDLLIITKDADGEVDAFEVHEFEDGDAGILRELGAEYAELLSEEDVGYIAEALEPGTVAAALVWENTWAAPFAASIRHSGGQLVASGRIPMQAILAALEADEEATATEGA
jgi:fructosamine-3-kinase